MSKLASEMHLLARKTPESQVTSVTDLIKKEALAGKFCLTTDISMTDVEAVIHALEADGFRINRGGECRMNQGNITQYVTISW